MTLDDFFKTHPKLALGFSGGTDSAYLLYEAVQHGTDVRPYYISTCFQPEFEKKDAFRLCEQLDIKLTVVEYDILSDPAVKANPANRCYYCKNRLFGEVLRHAADDGYTEVMDGTNASDDAGDRPGMRALKEMNVLSPLRMCGITKAQVRENSRRAGLFTHDKPAYACLATRIPSDMPIEPQVLEMVESSEQGLMDMGFSDLRVRVTRTGAAKLQLKERQLSKLMDEREKVYNCMRSAGFDEIMLDLKPR